MSRKVEVYQVLTQTLTEKKNAQLFYCTDGRCQIFNINAMSIWYAKNTAISFYSDFSK